MAVSGGSADGSIVASVAGVGVSPVGEANGGDPERVGVSGGVSVVTVAGAFSGNVGSAVGATVPVITCVGATVGCVPLTGVLATGLVGTAVTAGKGVPVTTTVLVGVTIVSPAPGFTAVTVTGAVTVMGSVSTPALVGVFTGTLVATAGWACTPGTKIAMPDWMLLAETKQLTWAR